MEQSEQQSQDKIQNINTLPRRTKAKLLFEAFINYPSHTSYLERLRDIAARTGQPARSLLQYARRHKWQDALASVVEAQKQDEAFAAALDRAAPLHREISFTALAAKVKNLSYRMLNTMDTIIDSTSLQIQFYATRIARLVSEVGGYNLLQGEELKRVENYHRQLILAAKSLEPYLKPGGVSQLLATINFSQQLPSQDAGEIDASAFTIASLAAKMRELGLPTAFDRPNAATAGYGPLPNIADPAYGSGTAPTAPPTTE